MVMDGMVTRPRPPRKYIGSARNTRWPITPKTNAIVAALFYTLQQHQMSIAEVARRTGFERVTLYRWGKGSPITLHNLEALAQVCGFTVVLHKITEKECGHE